MQIVHDPDTYRDVLTGTYTGKQERMYLMTGSKIVYPDRGGDMPSVNWNPVRSRLGTLKERYYSYQHPYSPETHYIPSTQLPLTKNDVYEELTRVAGDSSEHQWYNFLLKKWDELNVTSGSHIPQWELECHPSYLSPHLMAKPETWECLYCECVNPDHPYCPECGAPKGRSVCSAS